MEIRIDVANAEVISRAFLQAPAMVMAELERSMNRATDVLWSHIEGNTPKRTGLLAQNWISDVEVRGDQVVGTVSNALAYAIPVELGVQPHQRTVKNVTFTHPGFPGRKMAQTGLAESLPAIEREFTECAQRITARLAAADGAGNGSAGSPA